MRAVLNIVDSSEVMVGPLQVAQPLPSEQLSYADPFVLLHHAGPQYFAPQQEPQRIAPHPHRGFSPVTFVYEGKIHHKDSLGNEGFISAGEVQWMNSGKGLLHSEGPAADFLQQGGNLELIQLWINTPRAHKMDAPEYIEASKNTIPVIDSEGVQLRVVAGNVGNVVGAVTTFTPLTAIMARMVPKSSFTWNTAHKTALVYVLGGTLLIGDSVVSNKQLAVLGEGERVELVAQESAKLLLLSAEPLNEPISTGGPFVMNTRPEIFQAFQDVQAGLFGELRD